MGTFQDFEKLLWGKASKPAGGGTPEPPSTSQFARSLNWILRAIGLQSPTPPGSLLVSQIVPTLDAFQDGWPFATYRAPQLLAVIGAAGAFSQLTLVAADEKLVQRLMALEIRHGLGAAPIPMFVRIGPVEFGGAAVRGTIAQFTLAPNAVATMVDIFGARDIVIPPGQSLTLESLDVATPVALLAGETVAVQNGSVQRIPAGFHI